MSSAPGRAFKIYDLDRAEANRTAAHNTEEEQRTCMYSVHCKTNTKNHHHHRLLFWAEVIVSLDITEIQDPS